ncbi:MAG: hypothetical protein CM1200mP2_18910 [Planctomycetaceae bacterium]|nr:MAG: hypothetical protein CM1200mP2_18910 [Planctomycetaceae bacterium]
MSINNRLVDRGYASAAQTGVYGPEREWLIEGHGVDPDVVVDNLPQTRRFAVVTPNWTPPSSTCWRRSRRILPRAPPATQIPQAVTLGISPPARATLTDSRSTPLENHHDGHARTGFRQALHRSVVDRPPGPDFQQKSRAMTDKVTTVSDAVGRLLGDGDYLAIGGFGGDRIPTAVIHEVIRQNKQDLGFAGHPFDPRLPGHVRRKT